MRRILAALGCAMALTMPVAAMARPTAASVSQGPPEGQDLLVEVELNHQKLPDVILVLRRSGRLLVRREDLQRWRLPVPSGSDVVEHGEAFIALDAFPGLMHRIDQASQTLVVSAPASLFAPTSIVHSRNAAAPTPVADAAGAFLNYDLFADHMSGRTAGGALMEAGVFSPWGVGTGSAIVRRTGGERRTLRLETTWTRDFPQRRETLRLGDAITAAGAWGRAVRVGGFQWATNFATQPGLVTFPLPGLGAEAALPSTVDLYVNDALRLRTDVPPGPFSISDLPVVSGHGEMRLVVTDLLGARRVITLPFYASPRLLQQGLHEYSYESGFVRRGFGRESNDYGELAALATHRYGFNDYATGEVRAEVRRRHQALGVSGALLWPRIGVLSASAAASAGDGRRGELFELGAERADRMFSLGASLRWASSGFTQLGDVPGERAARLMGRAYASFSSSRFGSFGVSYAHQDHRDREDVRLLSANYSVSLGRSGFLILSVLHAFGSDRGTSIGVNFVQPLDAWTSASAGAAKRGGHAEGHVQVQRNLPAGTGFGYRVLGGAGESRRFEAAGYFQNETGTYGAEVARASGQTGFRATASGGFAFAEGRLYASRRIDESFAIVTVPGFAGVRVLAANHVVGRTGEEGTLLIPRLLPYQRNLIGIEQADLPLDASVERLELEAVPHFRSGIAVRFPVKRTRAATLTILMEGGEPMPAGAVARLDGDAREFPVGHRGEVFIEGLAERNRVFVTWKGRRCDFWVLHPDSGDPLPHLGSFTCAGVHR